MTISAVMASENKSPAPEITHKSDSKNKNADELLNNFMTLLVAQIQNQDPTKPMDNNQLTSQLAQFQTAAGIERLNTTVGGVGFSVRGMQQTKMADWVNKAVLIEGHQRLSGSEAQHKTLSFILNSHVDEVSIALTDEGRGERYIGKLTGVKKGINHYQLSQLTDFQPVAPSLEGNTTFNIAYSATTPEGLAPKITPLKQTKIESVAFQPSGALFQLGMDGSAKLDEIYLVQ